MSKAIERMSVLQFCNYVSCNPGGAAKAYEIWKRAHGEQGERVVEVPGPERVVYKDREVIQEVERVVEVEKEVFKNFPVSKVILSVIGGSLVGSVLLMGVFGNGSPQVVEGPVRVQERVVEVTRNVIPSDYEQLKEDNGELRGRIARMEREHEREVAAYRNQVRVVSGIREAIR